MHFHTAPENLVVYFLAAVVGINLTKWGAAIAARQPGIIGVAGRAAGALVQ